MNVEIAAPISFQREAFFFQAQHAIGTRPGRNFDCDTPIQRFDFLLAAQNRIGKLDRQIYMDITSFEAKPRMCLEVYRDQRIACRSAHQRLALPFQANGLTVFNESRQLDLQVLAIREDRLDLLRTGRLLQRNINRRGKVSSLGRAALTRTTTSTGASTESAAEKVVQNIIRAAETAALLKAAGTRTEFKVTVAVATLPETGKRVAMSAAEALSAGETLKGRLAFGIDLAPVKLTTLVLVAHNFIGLVQFCKALLRFRIILVLIRMVLFGQFAKSRFYFLGLRRFGDAQHAIGIAHIVPLSGK